MTDGPFMTDSQPLHLDLKRPHLDLRACPRCKVGAVLDSVDQWSTRTRTCLQCSNIEYPGHVPAEHNWQR